MTPSAPPRRVAAPPTVVALLLAEVVHATADRRANLLGVFNGYTAHAFTFLTPQTFVYLALTDGHGPTPLAVRLVDAADEDGPPLFAFDLKAVPFASPLEVREVAIEVPPVTLPRAGLYRWQVVCGGEVIHERRLVAQVAG